MQTGLLNGDAETKNHGKSGIALSLDFSYFCEVYPVLLTNGGQ